MEQNNGERKPGIRYSEAFKMALVRELEEGGQPFDTVRRKYGVGGAGILQKWARKYGRGDLGKVIRVEKPNEVDERDQMKRRIKALETALADAHLDLVIERAYTKIACERAGIEDVGEFKKKPLASCPLRGSRPWRGRTGGRQWCLPEAGHEPAELLRSAPAAAAAAGGR
jgi:transposase-like protein